MCGIVGIINFRSQPVSASLLTSMRDTMVHRGPDGAGLWISENQQVGFGHRRLAIIDPHSHADQPMISQDKKTIVCYNGEIYNHQELRHTLTELGVNEWQTHHSDTEVVLHAYRVWGTDCLKYFRGMFAFAIWDEKRQSVFCARDRLGVKPFYYYHANGRFIFASEIKAILKHPEVKRTVNETALYHYLSFLTTPAPDTLFQGIKKMPSGHSLLINMDGTSESVRYWDVLKWL